MIKVLYFARLRESLGIAEEAMEITATEISATTVADLMALLAARGDPWRQEFDGCRQIRAAVNQTLVNNDFAITDGDEVAFFPPVTGG